MSNEERAASASFTDPGFVGGESGNERVGRFAPPGRLSDTDACAGEGGTGEEELRVVAGSGSETEVCF